ncbi:hypothetical protein NWF32_21905 [Pseudomonas qingdaonensis]|nr:hypothetical protein [Pseudomonas qingdaonensis]
MLKLIGETPAWTPLTSVVTTLCMSVVLGLRHARSVRRIERFNLELAEGIERARGELATTLEREHALALTNSACRTACRSPTTCMMGWAVRWCA